jgi:hypothetical protein
MQAGWPSYHSIPGRAEDFAFLERIQTDFGAHAASYSVGTRGLFPPLGRESDLHLVLR